MKILNAQEFLKMPSGVFFSVFEDMKFWEFYEKGETDGNKTHYRRLLTNIKSKHGDEFVEKLTNPIGKSIELDFNDWYKLRVDDMQFAVHEKHEIKELISILEGIK